MNETIRAGADLLGRLLLVAIFAHDAWTMTRGYGGAVAYARTFGLPDLAIPAAIVVQLGGAILIAVGWYARVGAFFLAGFCLLTAFIFHFHASMTDGNEELHFLKDIAIAGGFLVLLAHGTGKWSLDGWRRG
jgi:putative oxidoreductase